MESSGERDTEDVQERSRIVNQLSDEEIWNRAFLRLAGDWDGAVAYADRALEIHRQRWPLAKAEAPLPTSRVGLSPALLGLVVQQLREEARTDAARVLESLIEAIQQSRAASWTPPPRGT